MTDSQLAELEQLRRKLRDLDDDAAQAQAEVDAIQRRRRRVISDIVEAERIIAVVP